jgi:sigma-54 specific flagellar transcriptional regulator A
VRIVAATHRDLNAAIREGRFREDLYYRLNVFPVEVAPLRERLADLPMLIEYFAARQAESGGSRLRLAPDAVDSLARCAWVGNVRELANLIERLSILHPQHLVRAQDLPAAYRIAAPRNGGLAAVPALNAPQNDGEAESPTFKALQNDGGAESPTFKALQNDGGTEDLIVDDLPFAGLDLKSHLARIEACFIRQALQASHGKVAEAARLLHLRRTTLVEKIRKGADNSQRYMICS